MSYKFHDDFSFQDEANKPYNIAIERNSDLAHGHASVIDNAYHILVCGNKHFAKTPPLRDFDLKLKLDVQTPQFEFEDSLRTYGFRIYFRYDRFLKEGYMLEGGMSLNTFTAKLMALDRYHQSETLCELEAAAPADFNHSDFEVSLAVKDNNFALKVDDVDFAITDDRRRFSAAGSVGLDKPFSFGQLIVREWSINSEDKITKSAVIEPLKLELPKIQGMSVAYQYTLNLSKYENDPYELDVELSGGIKDRPDRGKCGRQWCHEVDRMEKPYVRLESKTGEFSNIILFDDLKTLLDKEEKRIWTLEAYPQPEWPLRKTIAFEHLPDPDDLLFAVGYEYFFSDPKRFLAGGPFEVLSDSKGKILYYGQSLRKGHVAISVKSPENKQLCAMIPEGIPDREKALRHARENHYFYEQEKIAFDIKIQYHPEAFFPDEFKLNAKLQSIYGDDLKENITLSPMKCDDSAEKTLKGKLGLDCLCYQAEMAGVLATGLYHLNVKLMQGAKDIYHENVIFEVMSSRPDAVSPPIAAGLPELFSIPNEIKYLQTDAFDPLYEKSGAMHYFSTSCFYPDYGRAKRIWELLKLYKRKWFAAIDERSTPNDTSIEANADIIAHCDYLQIKLETKPRHGRYELWKEDIYKAEILDILLDFFKANPNLLERFDTVSLESLMEIQTAKGTLPQAAFIELVEHCWHEWVEFFSDRYAEFLKKQADKLAEINGNVRTVTGGPFSLYASHNKSAYFLNNFGHNVRGKTQQFYNGFWQFEDYAHSCGYSFAKAPFAMMTIKLHYPNWKLFPEIYSTILLDGCNDGAVSQAHPPYGFYLMPVALMRERIYEYAFATVWFKDNKFNYWRDNGFHLRNPKREYLNELLWAWGNVRKHQPARPVRTTCFLADVDLIAQHPDHYEKNCNMHAPWKDVINTAEEALVYSYDAARTAGIPAGFATGLNDLKFIDPEKSDLLILPPLSKDTAKEHIDAIRNLHEQGINLLAFENVHGLEDLFGVTPLEAPVNVQKISVVQEYNTEQLDDEFTEHELCQAGYAGNGAEVVLAGAATTDKPCEIPVLLTNSTQWGKTAFFNVPPTVVKRDSFMERVGYGQECVSIIMKNALTRVIKELSEPLASVNSKQAKLIAFHDEHENLVIVVEQECLATPDMTKYPQTFLLTVNIPGIKGEDISCDEEFSIASEKEDKIVLRVNLGKYESAVFTLKNK